MTVYFEIIQCILNTEYLSFKKKTHKLREKNSIGYGCKELFWNPRPCSEPLISIEDWYSHTHKPKGDNPLLSKWIIHQG